MLDCRAADHEIKAQAIRSRGAAAGYIRDIGRFPWRPTDSEGIALDLNRIAAYYQARPVDDTKTLSGRMARMSDAAWWVRNVRRELVRENEIQEHAAGAIRRKHQCYVSDHASAAKRARRKCNRATLEALEVENENGEAFNLLEVADSGISNPAIRRAELMMRCRGFEETAAYMGHGAQFLTITTPSRFHRTTGGALNPKWDGSTPKDGQAYLSKIWAKIRAAWNRAGFYPYGFRVAEPHHDGTPHWHILLFMAKEIAGWFNPVAMVQGRAKEAGAGVVGIAGRYAMADTPDEAGAAKHRFTVKAIDPDEGSATGYIAKYICKNIDGVREDGAGMGLDHASGTDAIEASQRVRDWAATWGIRQFQQIGGPSVTVWRELRRMRDEIAQPLQAAFDWEQHRSAADRSLWSLFWVLQGGPDVPRASLTLKPLRVPETGGKYGEQIMRIVGVTGANETGEYALRTRIHEWSVQRAGLAQVNAWMADQDEWMRINSNVQAFERAAGMPVRGDVRFPGLDFDVQGAALDAWTRVNNCTENPKNTFTAEEYADEIASEERENEALNARFAGFTLQKPPPGRTPGIYLTEKLKNEPKHHSGPESIRGERQIFGQLEGIHGGIGFADLRGI